MKRAVFCGWVVTLLLAACSWIPSAGPTGDEVVAQASPGGTIAFDVVKIDDAVLATLLGQREPGFHERFKTYAPPPELTIAVGDMVSVIIWEAAANGLFGNSLTEWSVPSGVASRLLGTATAGTGTVLSAGQSLEATPDLLAQLLGGAAAPSSASPAATPTAARPNPSGTVESATSRNVQELLDSAVQTGRSGTRIPVQQVGSDGTISIPYAGRIEVAGHTTADVQNIIEQRLGPRALEPQALVIVTRSVANSVSVAGDVVKGARIPLALGGNRLLDVIAAAGGGQAPVHETFVRLSRNGITATVPLAVLVADPAENIFAEPGDVLTLVRRPQTFSAFGATGKNAAITFNSATLSLTEALAKAGGLLDDRADPRAVFLFRQEPVGVVRALGQPIAAGARDGVSPVVYRLDLKDPKPYLLAQRFPVRDKDIIFVANAEFIALYKFFGTLSTVVGPIESGLTTCAYVKC